MGEHPSAPGADTSLVTDLEQEDSRQRRMVGSRGETIGDWGICWRVLGIARLHFTLSTGRVTSKTGAGDYALSRFDPAWHPIIKEALRIRRDHLSPGHYRRRPLLRRRHALDFMTHVIDDANLNYDR